MQHTTVRAFAPANVSCVFQTHSHKNPRWAGSSGFGFTLNKGVTVLVKRSAKIQIFFNKKAIRLPTVSRVLAKLGAQPLKVMLQSDLPLGCGFGLSGASALATAYAVNKLCQLKKSKKELAIIAHTAEVEEKTGLGDVVNQYFGGFLVKFQPSSQFIVKRLPFDNTPVYCAFFSAIPTKSILTNIPMRKQINNAAAKALERVKKVQTFTGVIAIGKEFVVASGLLRDKKTKETIEYIEKNGGAASMTILGNAVYSDTPFPGAIKLTISEKGARLL